MEIDKISRREYRRDLFEAFALHDRLEETGVKFEDLKEGEVYNYSSGMLKYTVSVLGTGIALDGEDRPLVKVESYDGDGILQDSTGGLLYGLSLDGVGNLPVPYLPPNNGEFRTLIIETLFNEEIDHPDYEKILFWERNLPAYD